MSSHHSRPRGPKPTTGQRITSLVLPILPGRRGAGRMPGEGGPEIGQNCPLHHDWAPDSRVPRPALKGGGCNLPQTTGTVSYAPWNPNCGCNGL